MRRCDDAETKRPAIFKQLLDITDKKKSQKLIGDLSAGLRDLLVGNEKDDFTNRVLCLGSTSELESNHGRLTTRGYHTKGTYKLYDIIHDILLISDGNRNYVIRDSDKYFE